jgi:hypothetical protein
MDSIENEKIRGDTDSKGPLFITSNKERIFVSPLMDNALVIM